MKLYVFNFKKVLIIIFLLVLLIIFATCSCIGRINYLDVSHNVGEAVFVSSQHENSKFDQIRNRRKNERENTLNALNDIINNSAASDEARKDAAEQINSICSTSLSENDAENMIMLRGYSDCVVHIAKNSVLVAIDTDKITNNDSIKIRDLISDVTNNKFNNIKIVAVE